MTARRKHDEPDWRAFERLVARIERDAGARGLTVTSPDRIRCQITGKLREVDASIRDATGKLTTVECRKRRGRQDVTWIEQLITKRDLIGAQSTIAVSASGFSASAHAIAEAHGIVLKEMHDVSADDLNPLACLDLVHFSHPRASIVSVALRYARAPPWTPPNPDEIDFVLPPDTDLFAPIFQNVDEGHSWSINDIWHQLQEAANPFTTITKGQPPQVGTACFPYPANVTVETPIGTRRLGEVLLTVALWIEVEQVWKEDAVKVEYSCGSQQALQRVEFASSRPETPNSFVSLQSPKDATSITDLKSSGHWPPSRR